MAEVTASPHARLISGAKMCARMLADTAKHHDGWSNSATWAFDLYFMQERENYDTLVSLLKTAKIPGVLTDHLYRRAMRVMKEAYLKGNMEPLDGDEKGSINVREIVDTLASELK
jgi:putative exporter of polyketide antibiotics